MPVVATTTMSTPSAVASSSSPPSAHLDPVQVADATIRGPDRCLRPLADLVVEVVPRVAGGQAP